MNESQDNYAVRKNPDKNKLHTILFQLYEILEIAN